MCQLRQWFAEEAKRNLWATPSEPVRGQTLPSTIKTKVSAFAPCITPWNFFRTRCLARKIAPALRAGCTVVCKACQPNPALGLRFGRVGGLVPGSRPGVINIVSGKTPEIGKALTSSDIVSGS